MGRRGDDWAYYTNVTIKLKFESYNLKVPWKFAVVFGTKELALSGCHTEA